MAKLILNPHRRPYQIRSEFRGRKWSPDTHEGRVANSDWSTYVRDGAGLIDPQNMPQSLALDGTGNLKPMFYNGFWNVHETVKDVIEELDPTRHQFVPLKVTDWRDNPFEDEKWFLMNVHFHQSSIIDDLTNSEPVGGCEETREKMRLNYLVPKVTVNPNELLPNVHLWRESRYLKSLFMSDILYENLVALKVKLPVHQLDLQN